MPSVARNFLIHLRLPFQAVLAPFFLLGLVSAEAKPAMTWIVAFVLVHAGLYGGATVFNSFYDKDQGPIGMLKYPPPLTRGMLYLAIGLQVVAILSLTVIRPFAGALALAMAVLGAAYSHPRIRLKSHLAGGLMTVALGQGGLAVLLGHAIALGGVPATRTWLLASAASLIALGLFPLTQIYQIEEDRSRGDRTMAIVWGYATAMGFSGLITILGLGVLSYALASRFWIDWYWIWLCGALSWGWGLRIWARHFHRLSSYRNHDIAMGIAITVALPLVAYLVYEIMRGNGL